MTYERKQTGEAWEIYETGHDPAQPAKAHTFAFDTETQVYLDGKIVPAKTLKRALAGMTTADKRKRISNLTWAWQVFDEVNGFYMSNDFDTFLTYCSRAGYKLGWNYNATFDFAQIDFEVLSSHKWKPHEKNEKGSGKAYNKAQGYTYESLHSDMGARYAYKLWFPYRHRDGHIYVHSLEFHDFMKLMGGGLKKILQDLDVADRNGEPIRKLEMDYQHVDTANLTQAEIDYCRVDVEGLYFAVKKFDAEIDRQSKGECHIFGKGANVMTAGGFAKREMLRSMYPEKKPAFRIKAYQKEHPITAEEDRFLRENHLYRGGISFVNPRYKGRLLTAKAMGETMKRYDVNSEYPYAMSITRDLVGRPFKCPYEKWLSLPAEERDKYECVLCLESVLGEVKPGYLGIWYDPFKRDFVELVDEDGLHLIFEREFNELMHWYDLEYEINEVILWRRGDLAYKPFIVENYELKATAKKEGNATLQACAKLKLNSSYGKLAERQDRAQCHYELNPETGAVHMVIDGVEEDRKGAMNVAVGALITSTARCYILSKIREVCRKSITKQFVYIDTDSIHAFADYEKADAFALGGLKLEAECEAIKYIAPKSYVDIERIGKRGIVKLRDIEIHSKGVNVNAVFAKLTRGKRKAVTLNSIDRVIDYGVTFTCLCAMNVKGGKVLLPTEKQMASLDLSPDFDEETTFSNMAGVGYLSER